MEKFAIKCCWNRLFLNRGDQIMNRKHLAEEKMHKKKPIGMLRLNVT